MLITSTPPNAYRGYRFPGEVIAHAVWLYLRFALSFRDVEGMLAERGIEVTYETVRFGGKQHWLWRAVDEHGATLDVLLQEQRDTDAAERLFQLLLGHAGAVPERINTDKLGSYAAAIRRLAELADVDHQQVRAAQRCNNRVEQARQPTRVRERRMGRFRCPISAQRFLAAFTRTWNLFRACRRSFTAPEYRVAMQERFAAWRVAAELRP